VCEVVRWLLLEMNQVESKDGVAVMTGNASSGVSGAKTKISSVTIVSAASEFIFEEVITLGARYRQATIDAGGVVQQGPLAVSVDLTSRKVERFMESEREKVIADEREWLERHGAGVVLSDVAFAPLVAAKDLGIPSILIGNFTWDFIYSEYLPRSLTDVITRDYSHASHFFRLPGNSPSPSSTECLLLDRRPVCFLVLHRHQVTWISPPS